MQFISGIGQDGLPDALAVAGRRGVNIDYQHRVVQRPAGWIERGNISELLGRRLHRKSG